MRTAIRAGFLAVGVLIATANAADAQCCRRVCRPPEDPAVTAARAESTREAERVMSFALVGVLGVMVAGPVIGFGQELWKLMNPPGDPDQLV